MNVPSLDLRRNLVAKACPFCGDDLSRMEKENCPTCGSPARARSLDPILSETIQPLLANAPLSKPLLGFAVTSAERKLLDKHFPHFKSVSLFGNYGSDHEIGVDARDLSRYPDNSFSGVFGILVFDYFAEQEAALRECYRTLAPGGIFFTLIAPYRLLEGAQPPHIDRMIKPRPGYFDYVPPGQELANVKVGRDWFVETMWDVGFEARQVVVRDAASGTTSEWFIGKKPAKAWYGDKLPSPLATVYRCSVCDNSFEGQTKVENCSVCGAPPRARTVSALLNGFVKKALADELRERLPILAIAMPAAEQQQIEAVFPYLRSVSLYGNYKKGDHEIGVDARDMPSVADRSCSAHFSIGVFDFFVEHDNALTEAFRVLAPGGVFCTHILPHRILAGDEAAKISHKIEPRPGYFDYLPQGTDLPSIKVGRDWFLAAMERAGFQAEHIVIRDAASGQDIGWFVGTKPEDGKPAAARMRRPRKTAPAPEASVRRPASRKSASGGLELRKQRPWYKKALTALHLRRGRDRAEAARNSGFRPMAAQPAGELTRTYVTPLPDGFGAKHVRVTLSAPRLPRDGEFAEHVFDTDAQTSTDQVITVGKGGVTISDDLGRSWKHIPLPEIKGVRLRNSFTLSDGSHLLQGVSKAETPAQRAKNPDIGAPIFHFDASWKFLGRYQNGICHWHGTRAIDECQNTIMYADYPNNAASYLPDFESRRSELLPLLESSFVFKSTDRGKTWRKVFEAGWQDIRHFHTLAADPFQPKTWWLSSGDRPAESRVWRSVDDGESWGEVHGDAEFDVSDNRYRQSAFRYTDIQILSDRLIWGSDDWLCDLKYTKAENAGARVFTSGKDAPLCPASIGRVGNPVRSIVDVGRAYLLITEAKRIHVAPRPQVFLMLKEKPYTLLEIFTADAFGSGTGFTYSMASRAAKDGRFFSYRHDTDVFNGGPRILQWDISFD